MPAKSGESIERMELTFRAEPVSATRHLLPGGWILWCLVGCAIGLTVWLTGRELLLRTLRSQLIEAQSTSEALIAVDGLARLSPQAGLEIVTGLEHPDPLIARTAYLRLDGLLNVWQATDDDTSRLRLEQFAQRLASFSEAAPQSNRLMAGSLASRIYGMCVAKGGEEMNSTKELCLKVLDRMRLNPSDEELPNDQEMLEVFEQLSDLPQMRPPDPLPPSSEEPRFNTASIGPSLLPGNSIAFRKENAAISETSGLTPKDALPPNGQRSLTDSATDSETTDDVQLQTRAPTRLTPMASVRMTVGPTQPRLADGSFATEVLSDGSHRLPESQPNDSFHSKHSEVLVATPATMSVTPIVRMKVVSKSDNLDGIQNLAIEELVRLLANSDPRVAQAAALALKSKGLSDEKLALASELATGTAERRLTLIQEIASNGNFEPRPWLLWMAEDGEPQVRQMAVSLLSSMLDNNVERALSILLGRERDPMVAQAMRRVLVADRGGLQVNR